ncbi:MAG TPA: anthranilate synthase component I family protein [Flavisolibacter sp.]|jgi:para-aminobenzoate synthetase component 1|nr:anthranilate synthase component I family protein [Flavisolibacter sp.]
MHTDLQSCTFPIADLSGLKKKVLKWLRPFSTFCFLDNQQYHTASHEAECLVGAGVREWVQTASVSDADVFFQKEHWLFGHLSYDLKESLHGLPNTKEDKVGFSPYCFFSPQIVLQLKQGCLTIYADEPEQVFTQLNAQPDEAGTVILPFFQISPVLSREAYIQKIRALQAHILRGDCYEINFCQAFFAEEISLDPFAVFRNLMAVSPNPFSAFYRQEDKYLICASPERFLARRGNRLLSQPIKGTIKRDLGNEQQDQQLRDSLRLSAKEQSENVMVVDLVRNDLTRVCKPATVKVDELFGIYSFPQVHQMISTISGEIKDDVSFSEILQATFPMGSMTGAPKLRVMQLIDAYEPTTRGIFSGSVGYKAPGGNFDFNVVIRSILYDQTSRYLSYQVGSGITFYCNAEQEWEECMLKAEAIKKVLSV